MGITSMGIMANSELPQQIEKRNTIRNSETHQIEKH